MLYLNGGNGLYPDLNGVLLVGEHFRYAGSSALRLEAGKD
jgi:hypothetical protein